MQAQIFAVPPAKNDSSLGGSSGASGPGVCSLSAGRPRVHADPAAKVRAHRAKLARIDVSIKPELADTLRDISARLDCSMNELLGSMIRFGLTNRNWKQVGLYGSAVRHD